MSPDVVMGFYFSPRGGSAQVARYLCRALSDSRWAPTLFSGSLGGAGDNANAQRFFRGIRCRSLDYSVANAAWLRGSDSMSTAVPMHASFEEKAGVPDRIFFGLDDAAYRRQVASWTRFFDRHHAARPTVVHLHHLTPMHEAVRRLWPDVPVITHLHGTELKMLAAAERGEIVDGPKRFVTDWVGRIRRWAGESHRSIVVSAQDHALATDLLPVDPDRVTTIGNGVDTDVFAPSAWSSAQRLALWRRWLVDEPRGWRPGGASGSIRYTDDDMAAFVGSDGEPVPVVLFAGRFMQFKRLQQLIEAHHRMRCRTAPRSVLVVAGGFPGEWEGEHPFDTVERLGANDVFFVGWRDHSELADALACSDVFAAPSVDEPFGLVYLEAMAAGLPAIATNTGGPVSFINVDPGRPTGWLVPPDDVHAISSALACAISDPAARRERGRQAASFVRERYSWTSMAGEFADLYAEVARAPTD